VMLPANVDNDIKILTAGANGEKSSDEMASNIKTSFYSTVDNARSGDRGDVLFVENDVHNTLILTSPYDNFVVLADLASIKAGEDVQTTELWLVQNTSHKYASTAGYARPAVWAEGTNFVWITGERNYEYYIVDLGDSGDINDAYVKATVSVDHNLGRSYLDAVIWVPSDSSESQDGEDGNDANSRKEANDMYTAAMTFSIIGFVFGLVSIAIVCVLFNKKSMKRSDSNESLSNPINAKGNSVEAKVMKPEMSQV